MPDIKCIAGLFGPSYALHRMPIMTGIKCRFTKNGKTNIGIAIETNRSNCSGPLMCAFEPYKHPHQNPVSYVPDVVEFPTIEASLLLMSTRGLQNFHQRVFHSTVECQARDARLRKGWCSSDGKLLLGNDIAALPLFGRRFKCLRVIGEGTYAQIIEAQDVFDQTHVAIKILNRNFRHLGYREAWCLAALHAQCKGVPAVRCLSSFHFLDHFCICLDLASYSLGDTLARPLDTLQLPRTLSSTVGNRVNLTYIRKICMDVLCVMIRLENLGLMHGDLKPDNILLTDTSLLNVMVADFGNFVNIEKEAKLYEAPSTDKAEDDCLFECQSICYRAPEILLGCQGGINSIADVWSLGIILLELFRGELLFEGFVAKDRQRAREQEKAEVGHHFIPPPGLRSFTGEFEVDRIAKQLNQQNNGEKTLWPSHEPRKFIIEKMIATFGPLPPAEGLFSHLIREEKEEEEVGFSSEMNHRARIFELLRHTTKEIDHEFGDLMCGLLAMDPVKRLSAKAALRHPFLQSEFSLQSIIPPTKPTIARFSLHTVLSPTPPAPSPPSSLASSPMMSPLASPRRRSSSRRIILGRPTDEASVGLSLSPHVESKSKIKVESGSEIRTNEEELRSEIEGLQAENEQYKNQLSQLTEELKYLKDEICKGVSEGLDDENILNTPQEEANEDKGDDNIVDEVDDDDETEDERKNHQKDLVYGDDDKNQNTDEEEEEEDDDDARDDDDIKAHGNEQMLQNRRRSFSPRKRIRLRPPHSPFDFEDSDGDL